eukprot:CAMPEP_0116069312 /NCGR_PEP_ID=MMETSP0322-20121206/12225_1 /TAXON_ID=163516 /ORGANISM="Leptocylindrus danicus var. apora, Strain B651" /LENGTH=457 /DNA_ID=CAMNT_0003556677 /DNA_START=95 /DNA_END=1468 /DNA_ORIENTATION=+
MKSFTCIVCVMFICSTLFMHNTVNKLYQSTSSQDGKFRFGGKGNMHDKKMSKNELQKRPKVAETNDQMEARLRDKTIFLEQSDDYVELRRKYESIISNEDNSYRDKLHPFKPMSVTDMKYDPMHCPDDVPVGYPHAFPVKEVLNHWQPDEPSNFPENYEIYQGICVFQWGRDSAEKILNYRSAEVPYVIRGDPDVTETARRWSHPEYLHELLGDQPQKSEFSLNNHFMYWKAPQKGRTPPKGWKKPTENRKISYNEWFKKANVDESQLTTNSPHWYYRINAFYSDRGGEASNVFLYDELPFFRMVHNLYMVEPKNQRGINCRFGMKGVIAENHFDGSRNSIAILTGERRYLLTEPSQCENLILYPQNHPSGRHSAVDWSKPDYRKYPEFEKAMVNEIVLQAGDVMYLPKNWFHYIISIGRNYQCNIRSGQKNTREQEVRLRINTNKCLRTIRDEIEY